MKKRLLPIFILLCASCSSKVEVTDINSPSANLKMEMNLTDDGVASFVLLSGEDTITSNSLMGMKLQEDSLDFTTGLKLVSTTPSQISEKYSMPTGKKMNRFYTCNEMEYRFENSLGAEMIIRARLFDDAFAFRYEFFNAQRSRVLVDNSRIDLSGAKNCWVMNLHSVDEREFDHCSDLSTIDKKVLSLPMLVENINNSVLLICESDVRDYPIACGYINGKSVGINLPKQKSHHDGVAENFISPWRVIIAGDDFADIVESQVVDHLAKPTSFSDTSWIVSGVNAFPWWANPDAQNSPQKMKEYIDLAAEMGWKYIEFDVAIIGNMVHSLDKWKTTPYVKEVVDYAKSKGVECFGWEDIKRLQTPQERKVFFEEYKRLGLIGCKVDFINNYSQKARRVVEAVAKEAADHKLMISFHGAQSPRGLARTYPNIMTFEAVKGSEYYISINRSLGISPEHNCTIPFTRNVLGSMDYTPSALSAKNRTTSAAHELALSVVFESGWQGMCDSPESYRANPLVVDFLKQLPSSWDETALVDGYPGKFCVMKRRRGEKTFYGGINNGAPRVVSIDLSENGNKNELTLLVDGKNEIIKERISPKNGKVEIKMVENGGFLIY